MLTSLDGSLELSSSRGVGVGGGGRAGPVRPGAAGLLTGIEYSRVRDSSLMYLTSLVTT